LGIKDLLGGLFKPAADAFKARAERKTIEKTLEAKIAEKRIDATSKVEFNTQEWERLSKWAEESTWKDEYITVSVVAIWNIIVIGAVAQAFGFPQILEGIKLAMLTLKEIGVDVGLIMQVTIFAGLSVYAWKKF
jgi:preprotein translocase subunit Sss1